MKTLDQLKHEDATTLYHVRSSGPVTLHSIASYLVEQSSHVTWETGYRVAFESAGRLLLAGMIDWYDDNHSFIVK